MMKLASILFSNLFILSTCLTFGQSTSCLFENEFAAQNFGATSINKNAGFGAAIDINIQRNEELSLDRFVVRLLSDSEIVSADITLFADNNGIPGNQLETISNASPLSDTIVGTTFGIPARQVTFDCQEFILTGGPTGTKFWIELSAASQDTLENVSWEISGETVVGDFMREFNNGSWQLITFNTSTYEAVYSLTGVCQTLEESDLAFTLYPNPTAKSVIMESNFTAEFIRIIDASGRVIQEINTTGNIVSFDLNEIATEVVFVQVFSEDGRFSTNRLLKYL